MEWRNLWQLVQVDMIVCELTTSGKAGREKGMEVGEEDKGRKVRRQGWGRRMRDMEK